jgi:oligopeptide transport system substrate-binding protein
MWKRNNTIQLKKNPRYWDKNKVYLDTIMISIVQDCHTTLLMFEKGELDWVGSPFIRMSHDTSSDTLEQEGDDALIYWFFINTEKYPLNNKKLRKALSYAIDRKSIVNNVFHHSGIPRMSALSPPLSLSSEPYFQDNHQKLAKELFKEALEELGLTEKTFPEITLNYVVDIEAHHRIAQAIQDQWRNVLGLNHLLLKQSEWKVHCQQLYDGDYHLGFVSWNVSVLDPSFILEIFRNKSTKNNICNWESSLYADFLDRSKKTFSRLERISLLKSAETLLLDDMPIIPFCSLKKKYAKNPQLKGEVLLPLQLVDFKSAYFE